MVVSLKNSDGVIKDKKKVHNCPKCKLPLDNRVHRGFFVKNFLFWLPLRRYSCYKCNRKIYVWVN